MTVLKIDNKLINQRGINSMKTLETEVSIQRKSKIIVAYQMELGFKRG